TAVRALTCWALPAWLACHRLRTALFRSVLFTSLLLFCGWLARFGFALLILLRFTVAGICAFYFRLRRLIFVCICVVVRVRAVHFFASPIFLVFDICVWTAAVVAVVVVV